ncbi:transposase domain-containing protein [Escherichia coli]|nr:transposase domain-containing protein [Escherichia coli]MDC9175927.1 transposase domain-containing protein [Escherichia coli]
MPIRDRIERNTQIGTCRLNGIDPEAYLRHILSVLPEWPSNRVDELLPWNVVLTNK